MDVGTRRGRRFGEAWRWLGAVALAFFAVGAGLASVDLERMRGQLQKRFGTRPLPVFDNWRGLLGASGALPERRKLDQVNGFFNRNVRFQDDIVVWQLADYWATPLEFIGQGAAFGRGAIGGAHGAGLL
ncbi:MAG: hypothetical protein BSR46_16475 [Candidatus Dactylopiibacterium carminicum]|uniref:hypothetical protein n=1 Tax=Candidatus Dactylopiibacterium carminicum TaxID=857335 RepID=UPI000BD6669B|nr:hypothetical protein [Candidatus Dactylopiibacterium carminicum]PAS95747.1 MAG: hypothetical protein BSR46_16475 [Candidatus Dactylopiibacterium carminicum]